MNPFPLIPFDSPSVTLETAGGKGMNLVRLTRAGFPVPRGFIVPTEAYRAFVEANQLSGVIAASIAGLAAGDAGPLETASAKIRAAFAAGKMPAETDQAVRTAYNLLRRQSMDEQRSTISRPLSPVSVAVRSSATAEDLPDLSFAGQQDTYLNVIGVEALLEAVIGCWSSLWTARAIGYRLRNQIAHEDAALAVVVQEMVQSDVSGVLFSANPLTGLRSETVIDATLGLGEALVSGQVEPDHYVVDTVSGRIVSKTLGQKKISTRGKKAAAWKQSGKTPQRGRRSLMTRSANWQRSANKSKKNTAFRRISSGPSQAASCTCCRRGRLRRCSPSPRKRSTR